VAYRSSSSFAFRLISMSFNGNLIYGFSRIDDLRGGSVVSPGDHRRVWLAPREGGGEKGGG
jgi:hypothetical protein